MTREQVRALGVGQVLLCGRRRPANRYGQRATVVATAGTPSHPIVKLRWPNGISEWEDYRGMRNYWIAP